MAFTQVLSAAVQDCSTSHRLAYCVGVQCYQHHHHHTTVLRPFFRDKPGEPVPEENFWTSWCKERLTEADTPTIQLGATPSGLNSAHLHYPSNFFTGQMPFLPPKQQCQSTEDNVISNTLYTYTHTHTYTYMYTFMILPTR